MRTVPLVIVLFLSMFMNGCVHRKETRPGYSRENTDVLLFFSEENIKATDNNYAGGYTQGRGQDLSNLPLCGNFTKFDGYNGLCLPGPGARPVRRIATPRVQQDNTVVSDGTNRGAWNPNNP